MSTETFLDSTIDSQESSEYKMLVFRYWFYHESFQLHHCKMVPVIETLLKADADDHKDEWNMFWSHNLNETDISEHTVIYPEFTDYTNDYFWHVYYKNMTKNTFHFLAHILFSSVENGRTF